MKKKPSGLRSSTLVVLLLVSLAMIAVAHKATVRGLGVSSSSGNSNVLRTKNDTKSEALKRKAGKNHVLGTPPPYTPYYLPLRGELNPGMASALVHEIPHHASVRDWKGKPMQADAHKLWSMFDTKGWTRRASGMKGCFADPHFPDFWENLLDEGRCNRNWYRGGFGEGDERNSKEWRADYNGSPNNPALMGYENDLKSANCKEIEKKTGKPAVCHEVGFVDAGYEAGHNMLRLDARFGWNMCRNLEWVVCAIQGHLPNQGEGKIRFATTPRLNIENYIFAEVGCSNEDCAHGYSVDDIFFVEVSLISYLCKNRDEVFKLEVGDDFDCDFDMAALDRLVEAGNQSSGGYSSPEMWIRPGSIEEDQ
jgi:hypothetical protein